MKLGRYLSFDGRTSRLDYWRAQIGLTLIWALVWCGGVLLAELTGITKLGLIALVASAPLLWLAVALVVRRLHDRNRTGWWALGFYGATIVTALFRSQHGWGWQGQLLLLAPGALLVWIFYEIGIRSGDRGPNRFGADPRAA